MAHTTERMRVSLPGSIPLTTRTGREIPNNQDPDPPPSRARLYVEHYGKSHPFAKMRRWPTGQYNCHGMTFASRRTGIWERAPEFVGLILKDDGYDQVLFEDVHEGDIVVYYRGNEIEHTAVVIGVKKDDTLIGGAAVTVISKWACGAEYVHDIRECPYVGTGRSITYWSDRNGADSR
ncbi:hypothetical protein LCGC14_2158890 [marine sediment metagenome]|uniref:Uncharacterized protein n=1 Tax=marine sediment metagenome TaxID=412755 RepID=A0A0F9DT83_9ZZZZ